MPLDWSQVKQKYGNGYQVPTVAGRKFLPVVTVDDDAIHVATPIWSARLARVHLEQAVALIEAGTISRDPGLFAEDYMLYVVNERATSVCHILRDLGFLDRTETFTIRC